MAITIITAATEEPITLNEAKDHLRVDHDDENDLIESLIATAREEIEVQTHRQAMTATLQLAIERFPHGYELCCRPGAVRQGIELPRPPLQSVESITYIDANGDGQTLDEDAYQVDSKSEPGRILPAYGTVWPATRLQPNAVLIEFVAGWTADTVPSRLKSLTKLIVAHLYENREPVNIGNITTDLPMTVKSLVQQLRWGDLH